jgi:protein-S-isoprenylcysteine O-methyltransferase Ste14
LIVAGIGLRAWSIATLGRFFQYQIQVQPGHHVVTGGLEERQLAGALGDEYEHFAAGRKRLVPGVW